MNKPQKHLFSEFDSLVENHLNLQVKISYPDHHDFLVRHNLNNCYQVLDVGTGNGTFVSRLADDHPDVHFVGIDKRRHCIESAKKLTVSNVDFLQVDMFSREMSFDFSRFDGFLMRYFLLHVDNSRKILELLSRESKRPSKMWIIDLDYSQITCQPHHEGYDKMIKLVKEFCAKISVESMGGQKVLPLMQNLNYQNIKVEHLPFSRATIAIEDFALYLKQEVLCYSRMCGRSSNDADTADIVRFIDEDVKSGKSEVSYGMILLSAEIN